MSDELPSNLSTQAQALDLASPPPSRATLSVISVVLIGQVVAAAIGLLSSAGALLEALFATGLIVGFGGVIWLVVVFEDRRRQVIAVFEWALGLLSPPSPNDVADRVNYLHRAVAFLNQTGAYEQAALLDRSRRRLAGDTRFFSP